MSRTKIAGKYFPGTKILRKRAKIKLTYLASPYSHPNRKIRLKRFKDICLVAARLHDRGEILFVPIAMSHPMEEIGGAGTSWESWAKADLEILSRCDELAVVMMDGWKESVGVTAEIDAAKEMGIPVRYIKPEPFGIT